MKEIKTAQTGEISITASFEDGILRAFEVYPLASKEYGPLVVPVEDLPKLVFWLQNTVLGQQVVSAPVKSISGPDPLAERKVINPALSGVQVFDNSSKIINKDVIKFTIPGNKS